MFPKSDGLPDWSAARKHLSRDPVLRDIMAAVGPCKLKRRRDYFVVLCKAIYTQQISTVVAAVLFGRFCERFPNKRPTPAKTRALLTTGTEESLRGCGLSRQKKSYLIDLTQHFMDQKIPSRRLAPMTDDQVIESLTAVKGIGQWTAEMFLIFTLNRPDVLPVDDLGLQTCVRDAYQLKARPGKVELTALAEKWRPYRTIATWYLWRGAGAAAGNTLKKGSVKLSAIAHDPQDK